MNDICIIILMASMTILLLGCTFNSLILIALSLVIDACLYFYYIWTVMDDNDKQNEKEDHH